MIGGGGGGVDYISLIARHYDKTPMHFHVCKGDNFRLRNFDYFHIFLAQNIDCGFTI